MRRGHEEGPPRQISKANPHSNPARVTRAHKAKATIKNEHRGGDALQQLELQLAAEQRDQKDNRTNRKCVPESNRRESSENGAASPFLQAEAERKEPAHRRIEAMQRTQSKQDQPGPKMSHSLGGGRRGSVPVAPEFALLPKIHNPQKRQGGSTGSVSLLPALEFEILANP